MRGDEGDLKAADEKAGGQQQIASVAKGFPQCLSGRLLELSLGLGAG